MVKTPAAVRNFFDIVRRPGPLHPYFEHARTTAAEISGAKLCQQLP
jgi:hypothetical protein